ncbi:anti-sigma factor family protein [Loktanella agnita]|uniref:anti-sigma factor family protein n=1 Tax=Loktanella agnita TaxID=287097 RepID=UPI003986B2C3
MRNSKKLSAFLDGELTDAESRELRKALLNDAQLRAELDQLSEANALAGHEFSAMLELPVSAQLISKIRQTSIAEKG